MTTAAPPRLFRTDVAGAYLVESTSERGRYYVLTGVGTAFVQCSCRAAMSDRPCKHVVAGLGESERLMEDRMSDQERTTTALAVAERAPIVQKAAEMQLRVAAHLEAWNGFLTLGEGMLASKLLPPSITSREAAALVLMKAYSLDIEPTEAFAFIDVIKGVPNLRAQMVRALVAKSGQGRIQVVESSSRKAVCVGFRKGWQPMRVEFTIEDAQRAGLLNNDNYKKFPADMLVARASVRVGRRMFPDVLSGMNVADYGEEIDSVDAPMPGVMHEDVLEGEYAELPNDTPATGQAGSAPAAANDEAAPPPSEPIGAASTGAGNSRSSVGNGAAPSDFEARMGELGLGWEHVGKVLGVKTVNAAKEALVPWLQFEGNTEDRMLSLAVDVKNGGR